MVGDHGHGHGHEPPFKIPDWRIYKVEDVPDLVQVRNMLADKGLKDPWLRNEVWKYNPKFGTPRQNMMTFFFRGFKYGFAAFLITIAAETAYAKLFGDSHHHHEDH